MDLGTLILILRYLFTLGGGALIAHGYLSQNGMEQGLGLIPAIAPMILGWITNLQGKAAVKEAAVSGIPVQPAILSPLKASPEATANEAATLPAKAIP